jgi:hypothetical protein
MKNYFPIPDEMYELVLEYDGRYDQARLLPSLRIIDFRLDWALLKRIEKMAPIDDKYAENYYLVRNNQMNCYEQQMMFYIAKSDAYINECHLMCEKFNKRCNLKTGHIKGITYDDYQKATLSSYEKTFPTAICCFSISKTLIHYFTDENGIRFQSEKLYAVSPWTKWSEDCLHRHKGFKKMVVKNGIELLDPKFVQKANKTKTGKELIKKMMKV